MLTTDYKFGEVHKLLPQIETSPERVQFRNIFENTGSGVSLLAFRAGQGLEEHQAPADVMVNVLEGEIEFSLMGKPHTLRGGEFMLVGQGVPHSVVARADSKVMLVKSKP